MSGSPGKPPIWSIFVVQAVSVIGDQIGQRASRYDFAHSSRRMLMALTFVSGTQILLVLGILQGALPASVSGAIYSQGGTLPCYEEVDMDGKLPGYCDNPNNHCHQIDCPSQGPGSMGRSIGLHPLLLLNGFINVAYYIGEVMLYHHPLGLVFIVIAALSATFVIDPMEGAMGLSASSPVPTAVIVLGIVGSVFCVIESKVGADKSLKNLYIHTFAKLQHYLCYAHYYLGRLLGCAVSPPREPVPVYVGPEESSPEITRSPSVRKEHTAPLLVPAPLPFPADDTADDSPSPDSGRGWTQKRDPLDGDDHEKGHLVQHDPTSDEQDLDPNSARPTWVTHLKSSLAVFIPFIMLSATYGLWFVTQKVFNDDYRTNMFGYTSIDQVLAPIYMWAFLLIVDLVPPFRRAMHSKEDQRESWFSALKGAFETLFLKHKGRAFFTVFTYRLLINARAVAYFYMGVNYDLTAVFLELQLVRVVLSWILAVVVCAVAPGFIGLSKGERNTVFAPLNMFFKLVGSAFVLAAIFIFNDSQN